MRHEETNREGASALALGALAWVLSDGARAQRLLDLTGLGPDDLRDRIADRDLQAEVLGFLEAHEPDLLSCAEELGVPPERLVSARAELER